MEAPIRFRLHQFVYSPTGITTELILKHSGLGFEVKNLPNGNTAPLVTLTNSESYLDPVLEDLFIRQVIFNRPPMEDEIARFIADLAPLMVLFPTENEGLQRILETYIRKEVEPLARKICDVYRDKWTKNDMEAGMIRYQREMQFGMGCLDKWAAQINELVADFYRVVSPFESILTKQPFLTGDRPVFIDYLLTGVIGTFLLPGTVGLLNTAVMLEAWYSKMRSGNFKYRESEMKLDEGGAQEGSGYIDITIDASEMEKPIQDLKMRSGAQALDLMTGMGHTAVLLAKKGFTVTAADASHPMLVQTAELANNNQLALTLKQHSCEEKLPYPDHSFNLVCIRAKAHLLSDPEPFVRDAARILRTYGYLMVVDNIIPDDQLDADQWLNTIEKLRDPTFVRYHSPSAWRKWCTKVGLTVTKLTVDSFKQPDLNWYLNLKNTPVENRKRILEMVAKATPASRDLFRVSQEDGKIIWYYRRMTLLAGKI